MAYFIPTNDPDFVYPERHEMPTPKPEPERKPSRHPRRAKYYELAGEPRFKAGDLVVFNHGLYMVRWVEPRTAKHGKGKCCYTYGVGTASPVAENKLTKVTDEFLNELNVTRRTKRNKKMNEKEFTPLTSEILSRIKGAIAEGFGDEVTFGFLETDFAGLFEIYCEYENGNTEMYRYVEAYLRYVHQVQEMLNFCGVNYVVEPKQSK